MEPDEKLKSTVEKDKNDLSAFFVKKTIKNNSSREGSHRGHILYKSPTARERGYYDANFDFVKKK